MGQKKPIKVQNFRLLATHKSYSLCYFTNHESVFLYILRYPSVSWHINPVKFSSWNITCFGQKQPIKLQFFRLLSGLMISPNSSRYFKNCKVSVYSNFAALFSFRYKNDRLLFCTFLIRNVISFGQKGPIKVQNFRLLIADV